LIRRDPEVTILLIREKVIAAFGTPGLNALLLILNLSGENHLKGVDLIFKFLLNANLPLLLSFSRSIFGTAQLLRNLICLL